MTGQPFDDILDLFRKLPGLEPAFGHRLLVRMRAAPNAIETFSEAFDVLARVASVQGKPMVSLGKAGLILFAATHGVEPQPNGAQANRVAALAAGGLPVNILCGEAKIGLKIFELALDLPTPDIQHADALSERDCAATIAFGMEAISDRPEILLLSSVGPVGQVAAAAVVKGLVPAVSLGDLLPDQATLQGLVATALARLEGKASPLDILRKVGGRDIAALVGAILAARHQHVPVVLDNPIGVAAAALCHAIDPDCVAHCLVSQPGHPFNQFGAAQCGLLGFGHTGISGDGAGAASALVLLRLLASIAAKSPSSGQVGLNP